MAEDGGQKTEQATPRRLEKAREEGQVASSRDFTAAMQFAVAILMLTLFSEIFVSGVYGSMRGTLRAAFRESDLTIGDVANLFVLLLEGPLRFVWWYGAALLVVGLLLHLAQTGFVVTPKRLTPDFKRLNPTQRLKDLPGENLAQTGKALLLLPLVGLVFWWVLDSQMEAFLTLPRAALDAGAGVVGGSLLDLLGKAALGLLAIGALDLFRQRRKMSKKLMMTKHEVRQEHKDIEGNPQVKARLRRIQRDRMRQRMMSQVPEASVVVTNPTHYAVALKYEPESMPAPVVVAKGLDYLALRIKRVAEEHEIPIVENPPLAQTLYRAAEVGDEIPGDMYRMVAEILAYIYKLRGERPFG